jgi:hypothetical protein
MASAMQFGVSFSISCFGCMFNIILGDTPRVATGISTNFKDKFESRN